MTVGMPASPKSLTRLKAWSRCGLSAGGQGAHPRPQRRFAHTGMAHRSGIHQGGCLGGDPDQHTLRPHVCRNVLPVAKTVLQGNGQTVSAQELPGNAAGLAAGLGFGQDEGIVEGFARSGFQIAQGLHRHLLLPAIQPFDDNATGAQNPGQTFLAAVEAYPGHRGQQRPKEATHGACANDDDVHVRS